MTDTPGQALVQSLLDSLPLDRMRATVLGHLLNPDTRVAIDLDTGVLTAQQGRAAAPSGRLVWLTADDIPEALRPPAVPDSPAELGEQP